MYINAAILAAIAFLYATISGRVERSWLSGPVLFVIMGLLLGPSVFGIMDLDLTAHGLLLLAELTLALVLFVDAANVDIARIRANAGLPERLLLIGLPLTILLGFAAAYLVFPGLGWIELALIAAILAPTDAALGKPVVVSPVVPTDTRQTLSFESGLNDGICVPIVVLLLGVAIGTEIDQEPLARVLTVVAEEFGIGLATGVVMSIAGSWLLRRALAHQWVGETWTGSCVIALAIACFTAAQGLGGSGFVACFVGGLVFRPPSSEKHALLRGSEAMGDGLALVTWVVFGAAVVGQMADRITAASVFYAILSLTVIRMLPVYLSLIGSSVAPGDRLFIGWFGPRGLASIVFGIIILEANLPGADPVLATIVTTVVLSVIAHGISANPLIRAFAGRWKGEQSDPSGEKSQT